jgi:ubiquinone/menaquinone biosynthesis C-methylase UbiE/uncharacterized protein YbaR (Trm112 family)
MLQELICCPKCKGDLSPETGETGLDGKRNNSPGYVCTGCGRKYPLLDDIADFLPDDRRQKYRGQKLMESERMVEIYESKWWRRSKLFALFMRISLEDEIALIRRIANLGPSDRALDLACGPGLFTRALAEGNPDRNVFGLDLSWPMLRYGTKKAKELGLDNLTFFHGDAHELPFKDASLDAANCCGAMHLFSDIRRVLNELHRVLKPHGRFSAAMALVRSRPLSRLKAYLDETFWGMHYFREEEIQSLLDEAGFEPTIHHARGVWMIAGGVRRP